MEQIGAPDNEKKGSKIAAKRKEINDAMTERGIPGFRDFPPSEFVDDARALGEDIKKASAPVVLGAGIALGTMSGAHAQQEPLDRAALTRLARGEPIHQAPKQKLEFFSPEEKKCIVDNIYHEARGEKEDGWRAVMLTMFGRQLSREFPNTACGVVYQKNQFSWTFDKKILAQPINPRIYLRVQGFVEKELHNQDLASAATMLSMRLGLPVDTVFYKVKGFEGSANVQKFFASLGPPIKIIGRHEFYVRPPTKGKRN
jgi:N-acetylmuramoyl-L-alanine amidase